jgi:hypothetical protein
MAKGRRSPPQESIAPGPGPGLHQGRMPPRQVHNCNHEHWGQASRYPGASGRLGLDIVLDQCKSSYLILLNFSLI